MNSKKPYWNKKQVAAVKKYVQSEDFAKKINEINKRHEQQEAKEKQEYIAWWLEIKDVPFI